MKRMLLKMADMMFYPAGLIYTAFFVVIRHKLQ